MADQLTTAVASGANQTPLSSAIITVQSQEILLAAQPLLRFRQVATLKTELSVMPGRTISFLRYNALTGDAALTEGVDMETDNLSASQITITVGERGKAVQVTELLLRTSFDDVMKQATTQLGRHFARDEDAFLRDILLGGTNVVYGGGKTQRSSLTTSDVFDTTMVKDMVETLATNKAPKINGDAYVCFIHPHQARKLRDDPHWIQAAHYGAPGQIFAGEIGRYEDVRFIETTHTTLIQQSTGSIYADGTDTSETALSYSTLTDTYQAIMVGDHAMGYAIALPVELRDNGVLDHGRRHSLAWYDIVGGGIIEDGHIVIGESA